MQSNSRPTAAAIEDPLLEVLRVQLKSPQLEYADRPSLLGDGVTARAYAFRLSGIDGQAAGPLVCRLFVDDAGSMAGDQARIEGALQNALAECAVPCPRVFACGDADGPLGASFMAMEQAPGWNLFPVIIAALGVTCCLLFVGVWTPLVAVLALYWGCMTRLLTRVHRAPADRVRRHLDQAGIGSDRLSLGELLERIEDRIERGGFVGLRPLATWLTDHREMGTGPIVPCHGDFWFGNVMLSPTRVSLLDWTQACLAPRELDLGWMGIQHYSRAPIELPISDATYDFVATLLRPFTWLLFAANRGIYRMLSPIDPVRLRYYTVLQCTRALLSVADARQAQDAAGSSTLLIAWGSPRTVELVRRRVRRLCGVRCELPCPRSAAA